MKVGIFSDTHLGFDAKGERCDESFDNLAQAINLCVQNGADLIVLPGDVFDEPVPTHNNLYRAVQSFSASKKGSSQVKLTLEKGGQKSAINYAGVPILAIHGNHEYLGKETRTALDVLNLSGVLVYFHAATIVAQKGEEKLAVHGLGAVPEKKALAVMQHWNPIAVAGASNIMLVHQSFKEFMAIEDEMVSTLSLEDLPKGFDLIIDGHLHWASRQELPNASEGGGKSVFLLAGSTIATSIKKLECEKPKGVHFFDTQTKELSFVPIQSQRKMFYHQINLHEADAQMALSECRAAIAGDLKENFALKPLIRVNLKGSIKKGLAPSEIGLGEIFGEFSNRAILSISKNFSAIDFKRKIADLQQMQKSRLSVAQLGFELLEKNLQETDFGSAGIGAKELFDLLEKDEIDKAMLLLTKDAHGTKP